MLDCVCFVVVVVVVFYLVNYFLFFSVVFPFLVPLLKLMRRIATVMQKSNIGKSRGFLLNTAQQMIDLRKKTGSSPVKKHFD